MSSSAASIVAAPELLETLRELFSSLQVEEVERRLIERTRVHLDASGVSLFWVGVPDNVDACGVPGDREPLPAPGIEIASWVAARGKPLCVQEVGGDARFSTAGAPTHSWVAAPLRIGDEIRAVLCAHEREGGEGFDSDTLRVLEVLAEHGALALANAERYELTLRQSQLDALTGLAHHGHFWSTLEVELGRAERYSRTLGLVLLDIDDFKAWNDRHGHLAGDSALLEIARILVQSCRSSDTPARYGGEEFAILLPETDSDGAVSFAAKVCDALASRRFAPGEAGEVRASAGVACYPADAADATSLVGCADERLYSAKRAGRNRVCAS